jgi:hypothetical protein
MNNPFSQEHGPFVHRTATAAVNWGAPGESWGGQGEPLVIFLADLSRRIPGCQRRIKFGFSNSVPVAAADS